MSTGARSAVVTRAVSAAVLAALIGTLWVPVAGADEPGPVPPVEPTVLPTPDPVPEEAATPVPEPAPTEPAPPGSAPAEPAVAVEPDAGLSLAAIAIKAPPTKVLPTTLDAAPGYQASTSCDPNDKPGILMFAELISAHWGMYRYHTSRQCVLGDGTQHAEGRALDWTMNAYDPTQKALGDAVVAWLAADDGALARRFGIMYLIWDRQIWYTHRPTVWQSYSGSSPHTDHIHFSFTWDGAMGRTSWWTGVPVTVSDVGTCRVYQGQYAPRYTTKRTTACPSQLPEAPWSAYAVTLPGATGSHVSLAQTLLGVPTVDGEFGPATLGALLGYQETEGLPVTGVLDNATWARLVETMPEPPFQQLVAAPDMTGDGLGDAVVVDSAGRLSIFPGETSTRFGAVRVFGVGWSRLTVYAPGDWDGDGAGDLMAVAADGGLWLYPGEGRGRIGAGVQIGRGWTGYRITPSGDLTGDGVNDLLAIDAAGTLFVYPGAGGGRFGARFQVGRGWSSVDLYAAGDQNRDGAADILGITPGGALYFYAGTGNGSFARPAQVGKGWGSYAFASGGDFNGDRVGDLLGRDSAGDVWLYPGRSGGGFGTRTQLAHGW